MWVDVEGNETEGFKAGRIDDGHVVSGVYGACGHVGSCTGPNVRHSILQHAVANNLDQLLKKSHTLRDFQLKLFTDVMKPIP